MKKSLIIQTHQNNIDIALMEDNQLVELHKESATDNLAVGDIYLAKPRKILPGLNAAFINMGTPKDAFLHYSDLGPQLLTAIDYTEKAIQQEDLIAMSSFEIKAPIHKDGKIVNVLPKKTMIMVQVEKEPISTKGPRITTNISLAGRYLVLIPFENTTTVSRKIASHEERNRLHLLCESLRPKNFGLIIRTAAENRSSADIHKDILDLVKKWENITRNLYQASVGTKLESESNKTTILLRDLVNDQFEKIIVNDKKMYEEVNTYLSRMAQHHPVDVELYKGKQLLFDAYQVTSKIKSAFSRIVNMQSGCYLIIEKTEAMHVIDVNSGHRVSQSTQDESAYHVNKEAAEEIARQIRLRDLGGLIVIDFIDMKNQNFKNEVFQHLRRCMEVDRSKHSILPLSRFNLCEITRERTRPELGIHREDECNYCNGTGMYKEINLSDYIHNIESRLRYIIEQVNPDKITLEVHPLIHAYLLKGIYNYKWKWVLKYHKMIHIVQNPDLIVFQSRCLDEDLEEIKLLEEAGYTKDQNPNSNTK